MEPKYHYDTLAKAIEKLQQDGYTIDFNLKDNDLLAQDCRYDIDNFKIRDSYRYEGISDPADEVVVYAIADEDGHRGIFLSGYGYAGEDHADAVLVRLKK